MAIPKLQPPENTPKNAKKKLLKTKTIVLGITKTAIQGKWESS